MPLEKVNATLGVCGCCGTQPGGGGGGGGGPTIPPETPEGTIVSRKSSKNSKWGFTDPNYTGINDDGTRYLRKHVFDQDGDLLLIEISRFSGPAALGQTTGAGVPTYQKEYYGPPIGNATTDLSNEYAAADFESDTEVLCEGQGGDQCEYIAAATVSNVWKDPDQWDYDIFTDPENGRLYHVQESNLIPNGDTLCTPGNSWPLNNQNPHQMEVGALVLAHGGGPIAGKAERKAPGGSWRDPDGEIVERWCLHGRIQYWDPLNAVSEAIAVFYKSTIPPGHHPINGRLPASMSAPSFYRYADVRNTFEDEATGDDRTEVIVEVMTNQGATPTPRTGVPRVSFPPRGPSEGNPSGGVSQEGEGTIDITWAHDEPWAKFKVERADDAAFSVNLIEIDDVDQDPLEEPVLLPGHSSIITWSSGTYYKWKITVSTTGMTPGTDYYYRVRAYYHADNRTWSEWITLGTGSSS